MSQNVNLASDSLHRTRGKPNKASNSGWESKMTNMVKVVFGYGATDEKTQWKRLGRLRNRSLERSDEGVHPVGLDVGHGEPSYPFVVFVTLTVDSGEQEEQTLAAKAAAMFLEKLPGHSLLG